MHSIYFIFHQFTGLFQECANSNPVSFLHVSDGDNTAREQQQGFDRPRFVSLFLELWNKLSKQNFFKSQ